MNDLTYKKIIAIIVFVIAIWIAWVFYQVIREKSIKRWDYIRSKWKILLFWFVVLAIVLIVLYFFSE